MGESLPDATLRPIALTGFMGAGKSSVGRRLAQRLGREFCDTDVEVERRTGRTVVDLFRSGDVVLFRDTEAASVEDLVRRRPPAVLALGGGALERAVSAELVVRECVLVHLAVEWREVQTALPRLLAGRPLLAGRSEEQIHDLFIQRQAAYGRAHLRVERSGAGVDEMARSIAKALDLDAGRGVR